MKTLEEVLQHMDSHSQHGEPQDILVNAAFKELLTKIWDRLPSGQGKTVAFQAIDAARAQCNLVVGFPLGRGDGN